MELAKYVTVFTTLSACRFVPEEAPNWYRLRWPVEPVFRRFRSAAHLGHLPKRGRERSGTWHYDKQFTTHLTEKLVACADAVSPLGYGIPAARSHPYPIIRVRFLLNQIRPTIEPTKSIQEVLKWWTGISRGVAEPQSPL